jgi:hypothetical protein
MKSPDVSLDMFNAALPKGSRNLLTQKMVDNINNRMVDPVLREAYRDNLIGFAAVMGEGKYRMQDYINAVRYVSFKVTGSGNSEAYIKTFPDRYQRFLDNKVESKAIAAISTGYNKSKLVMRIYELTLVPTYILNADLHQRALNTQADLMINAKSEKVKSDAANSILTHLKRPEAQKVEIAMTTKGDSVIDDLRKSTLELVKQQKMMIESKQMTTKEIAHSQLIIENAEFEEVPL